IFVCLGKCSPEGGRGAPLKQYTVWVVLSSVEKKLRFLMETFQDYSPYSFNGHQTVEGQN
ncbi:MAG: hypothetical protein ACRC7W_01315, partial [Fusobacteriaceae bacterium]